VAIDLGVWGVTRDSLQPIKNPDEKPIASEEKEIHHNIYAKNCLFKSISIDVFNQGLIVTKANEISLKF